MRYAVVFVTCSGSAEARKIARRIVGEKLAACVNQIDRIRSVYRWKGKVEEATETLLILKTERRKLPALSRRIRALHSYSVPEVIALPIAHGNPAYLNWIRDSLGK